MMSRRLALRTLVASRRLGLSVRPSPAPISAPMMSTVAAPREWRLACVCDAVEVLVSDDGATGPLGASFCHCSVCRRLSGAPFSANVLWPARAVRIARGEAQLQAFGSSKQVERCRCSSCGSPVLARLGRGGKTVALPLGSFDAALDGSCGSGSPRLPTEWAPRVHLHYAKRVVDVEDSLPKFAGPARGPRWVPESPGS